MEYSSTPMNYSIKLLMLLTIIREPPLFWKIINLLFLNGTIYETNSSHIVDLYNFNYQTALALKIYNSMVGVRVQIVLFACLHVDGLIQCMRITDAHKTSRVFSIAENDAAFPSPSCWWLTYTMMHHPHRTSCKTSRCEYSVHLVSLGVKQFERA